MKPTLKHNVLAIALFAVYSTTTSASTVCRSADSDPDGDGWGWENNSSCMVTSESVTSFADVIASIDEVDSNGHPICTLASSDENGDGWGWEYDRSCVITSSSTTTSPANDVENESVSEVSTNSRPVCSSASSDPDGDGWGWENNQSCVSVAGASDNTQTTTTEPEIAAPETIAPVAPPAVADDDTQTATTEPEIAAPETTAPVAPPAATDDDTQTATTEPEIATPETTAPVAPPAVADDDTQTATTEPEVAAPETTAPVAPPAVVVVEQEPVILPPCSIPALDDDNDGTGRENNQDCTVETPVNVRIMAVGDSITHGTSNQSAASYRRPFTGLMTSGACEFTMVGSQAGNHFHDTFVSPHEGYNGHTADNILNGLVDNAGNNEGISVTANRFQPHVVMLHVGSNDMRLGQSIEETVAEIDQVISIILATDSAPVVMLANVIPWFENATVGANVDMLGDRIEAYVDQLNDPRVQLVDVRGGFERSMILDDGVHPNPTGEQHIADRFFEVYDSAGFCR